MCLYKETQALSSPLILHAPSCPKAAGMQPLPLPLLAEFIMVLEVPCRPLKPLQVAPIAALFLLLLAEQDGGSWSFHTAAIGGVLGAFKPQQMEEMKRPSCCPLEQWFFLSFGLH